MLRLVLLAVVTCAASFAEDWPQFLGPARNGVSTAAPNTAWPKTGPPQLWKMDVGHGFSSPVVARGRLFLFHRIENRAVVDCLDANTGKRIWSADYPTLYRDDFGFDEGPRGTPA